MSHTSVKHSSSTGQQPVLDGLIDLGFKVLLSSVENARTMMQSTQSFLSLVPRLAPARRSCPCEIPEVECPPRCVCEVQWNAVPGETVDLTIRVTNSSRIPRKFALLATPFAGGGASPGAITLAPTSLPLEAGQSGIVSAKLTVLHVPEGEYDAEIVVRGAYEQYICVRLHVQCKKTCGNECCMCEVVQGDPPVRVRAHQWYHHFQCTEPCMIDSHHRSPDLKD